MLSRFVLLLVATALPLAAGSISTTARYGIDALSIAPSDQGVVVELRGAVAQAEPGMPRLPQVTQALAIPAGAEPTGVTVTAEEWQTIPGKYDVAPAQPAVPLPMPGRTFISRFHPRDAVAYGSEAPYPAVRARLLGSGTMNGYRIANVELHPVRWIPATGELQLATRLSYRLSYDEQPGGDVVPTVAQQEEYGRLVRSLVANPADVGRFRPRVARSAVTTLPAGTYPYVVISAPPIDTCFQRLVNWKTAKGVPATIVTVSYITSNYSGYDTQEKIRNFIIDAHSTWGTNYVLLGGSGDQRNSSQNIVPARRCYYYTSGEGAYTDEDTIPCDLYYGGLTGTWDANGNHVYGQEADNADMYADVHVGRASVYSVAQAQNFVNKVLTYEQNPPANYARKMLLPAAILWSTYEERPTQESIARMTPSGWLDAKLYERTSMLSQQRMIDSMNSGFGLGHWIGHGNEYGIYMGGSPYLNSNNADNLTNASKVGIHISNACFTGAWDELSSGGDCFAEHLMNRVGGGAVGMVMNSRYGWGYTTGMGPSEWLDTAFCSAILDHSNFRAGQSLTYAKSALVPEIGAEFILRWCIYELNLFGDPELPIWTNEPAALTVTHSGTITTGTNLPYPVTVTTGASVPVETAKVVLWKGNEVYATGLTNSSGQVTLLVSPQTAGTMQLTVTARNYIPYQGTVTVTTGVTHDVGCVSLRAPAGTIDSGTVVTPACTVANFGSTAESYTVRMKIGAGYNQTASVSSQGAGARTYVTFPNWTATGRNSFSVTCSTELATDAVTSNDKQTGSVTLAVRDVGCASLRAPSGTVDSGTVITPACTVVNYGTGAASYTVRMKIGSSYNQTASVSGQAAGARTYVTFPAWTASPRGTFAVTCSTEYSTDMVVANNKATGSVTVNAHDVSCVSLRAPAGTIDSGTVVRPPCTVANFGSAAETYTVRMKVVGTSYNQTATVTSQAAGARTYVTFPNWTAAGRNSFSVTCSTELATDGVESNDKQTGSVTLNVDDVSCVSLRAPAGTVDSGTVVTPACTVANFGTGAETYTVRMKVVGTSYNQTATVTSQASGARTYVTFPAWTASPRGTFAVTCSTELATDMVAANNKQTGSVTVGVHDVGCVSLRAPAGTIDSGTVVTPACTVANFGNATETYTVRMKVAGTSYNQTATITSQAAGARTYCTFPTWTVDQRGTFAVTCSTELATDGVTSNDKQTGSVTVNVDDVGCVSLRAPSGTVDSGIVVTPACTVANFGSAAESYTVRMKIGAGYNQTATVSSQAAGARTYVTFPAWTAAQRGTFSVTCSTELVTDMVAANNKQTGSVTVAVHDVGCLSLLAPAGTVDSGVAVTPACTVANFGTGAETYVVRMKVAGTSYDQTATVTSQAAGARTFVTFPDWTPAQRGTFSVSCSTELAADMAAANDKQTGSVTVAVHDVGCQSLLVPSGTLDSGTVVAPACTVVNFGTATETYTVRMKIVGTSYNQVATVTSQSPGARNCVTFPTWTAGPRGSFAVTCSTELTADGATDNDKQTGSVTVNVDDAGCVMLLAPSGTIDSGTVVTPACTVANFGTGAETYVVRMKVTGTSYDQTATVTSQAPGARTYVTFPAWTASRRAAFSANCSTALATDMVPANDRVVAAGFVAVHDVALLAVTSPTDSVLCGPLVPAATLSNRGTGREPVRVFCSISSIPGYLDSVMVPAGLPTTRDTNVTFASWNAVVGDYTVRCSVALATEQLPADNAAGHGFTVIGLPDVGVARITAPSGNIDSGAAVVPAARVRNYGSVVADFSVACAILRGATSVYADTVTVNALGAGESLSVTFSEWPMPHAAGRYAVRCSTLWAQDARPSNDGAGSEFVVAAGRLAPGWHPRDSVPGAAKVKDGGALCCDQDRAVLYSLRGNRTFDFLAYDPYGRTWSDATPVPSGPDNRPAGKGGALCWSGDWVFALKGNNTREFYKYDAAAHSWAPALEPVPLALDQSATRGRTVKPGASLAYVSRRDSDFVYILKGYGTEFYRYDVARDTHVSLAPAPFSTREKYDKGSWIVYDGSRYIYAMQARYNALFRYDVMTEQWVSSPVLAPMPFNSPVTGRTNKKVGDGGCATWDGTAIYALKGNNTLEFWKYRPGADSWTELESIPQSMSAGGQRRKVKAGAGMAYFADMGVFYAQKGNNSRQFWVYQPGAAMMAQRPQREGVMAGVATGSCERPLTVTPSVLHDGSAVLKHCLPTGTAAQVGIYDASGRVIRQSAFVVRSSSLSLDLRDIPAGVYLVRLDGNGRTESQKLVIER